MNEDRSSPEHRAEFLAGYERFLEGLLTAGLDRVAEALEGLRKNPFQLKDVGSSALTRAQKIFSALREISPTGPSAPLLEGELRAIVERVLSRRARDHWATPDEVRVVQKLARHMRERDWVPFDLRFLGAGDDGRKSVAVVCERFADVAPRSRPALREELGKHFAEVFWVTEREARWSCSESVRRVADALPLILTRR